MQTTNYTRKTSPQLEIAYIQDSSYPERAYVVRTSKQLARFNIISKSDEVCYPALYVSLAGMFHPVPISRKKEYDALGYEIINP